MISYSVAALVLPAVVAWAWPASSRQLELLVAVGLWGVHFGKRTLEAWGVHRYSGRPISVGDGLSEYAYYWGFGGWIAWGLASPGWQPPGGATAVLAVALFVIGQLGNARSHWILRQLRPHSGSAERKIPEGFCFRWLSCPHYTFEILSWLGFALYCRVLGAWVFTAVLTLIVSSYAWKRHRLYLTEFDGTDGRLSYPPNRRAIIPFVLLNA